MTFVDDAQALPGAERVRLVRVFVSSPGDLVEERRLLIEVVDRINRTMGSRAVRIELSTWERDVVPRIGPPPQEVVNQQMQPFCILLGIMANRFGTPTGRWGSGTEEEFRTAFASWGKLGAPWILFYFNRTPVDPDLLDPDQLKQVKQFREELATHGLYASYVGVRGAPESFFEKVELHLRQMLEREVFAASRGAPAAPQALSVPIGYTRWLQSQCSEVELLGLRSNRGYAIGLKSVYVPLTTSPRGGYGRPAPEELGHVRYVGGASDKPRLLLDALAERSLCVTGPPGSGKSTFCRWIAWITCHGSIPGHAVAAPGEHEESWPAFLQGKLPVLVQLRDFWTVLSTLGPAHECSRSEFERTLLEWISKKMPSELSPALVQAYLAAGSAVMIFDGIDEVPLTRGAGRDLWRPRALLVAGLAATLPAWIERGNRVIVSSRPYGLQDAELRSMTLEHAAIEPLNDQLQALLVRRWFHVAADPGVIGDTASGLLSHLRENDWLTPLRTSPMLLTAMCVVYGEGKRLPQDRHDLYTRIIDNVLNNRFPGDVAVLEAVRNRLSVIAHAMHTGTGLGEARQTPEATATYSEILSALQVYRDGSPFTEQDFIGAVEAREQLLSQTGLLIPLPDQRAGFYHFSIQEFLAAQRIVDLDGDRLADVFTERGRTPEWRNTLSFVFSAILARYTSPERSVRLLEQLVDRCDEHTVDLAVSVAECLDVLLWRGIRPAAGTQARFISLCLRWIELEVPVRERRVLGMTLGRLGDPRVPADLADPMAWVQLTPGPHRIGETGRVHVLSQPLWITRHLVTNGQYARFVAAGGYDPSQRWWSADGREWLLAANVKEPLFWRSSRWNAPNQPVVGISFWEAQAFCNWARGRLPLETEWECAARGPEGHQLPWGDHWDGVICNVRETGLNATSPVGLFPRSRSATYGLEDMAGNVWEWCVDQVGYDDGAASQRLLRGCSWHDELWTTRAQNRGLAVVGGRFDHIGLRVVRDEAP